MNAKAVSKNSVESKRIKQLRRSLAKVIPKFPNNQETLDILEAKSIGSLLIDYINWVSRLIHPRPRRITIEPSLTADTRWNKLSPDITAFLERVRRGDDLNPNLSLRALHNGFTSTSFSTNPATDKWEDKDFLLIVMGYHHFHLSQSVESAGHAKRTNEVLFAQVKKDEFFAIGIFDHSVFESTDQTTNVMSIERDRLWRIFDQRNSIGREPSGVYVDSPITTSGHSLRHVRLAMEYAQIIKTIDTKIDDLSSRSAIFEGLPDQTIRRMKLKWHLDYLNLGLIDKTSLIFYVLRYGSS